MNNEDEKGRLRELINLAKRRLHELQKQALIAGISTEPRVLLEIEDLEGEIRDYTRQLQQLVQDGQEEDDPDMALSTIDQPAPRPAELRAIVADLQARVAQALATAQAAEQSAVELAQQVVRVVERVGWLIWIGVVLMGCNALVLTLLVIVLIKVF